MSLLGIWKIKKGAKMKKNKIDSILFIMLSIAIVSYFLLKSLVKKYETPAVLLLGAVGMAVAVAAVIKSGVVFEFCAIMVGLFCLLWCDFSGAKK